MIAWADAGLTAPDGGQAVIRVFILDDHELVRRGLQELLEGEGFAVVGSSGSAVEATRRIPALHPDVCVLDARLPDGTGIEVCRDVRSVDPSLNCIILTSFDDEQALRGAVLAGRKRIRAEGDRRHGPDRRPAAGSSGRVPLRGRRGRRRRGQPGGGRRGRPAHVLPHAPGTQGPGAGGRRTDQPADCRRNVPGGKDRQELCVVPAGQARIRTPHAGRRLHRQPGISGGRRRENRRSNPARTASGRLPSEAGPSGVPATAAPTIPGWYRSRARS